MFPIQKTVTKAGQGRVVFSFAQALDNIHVRVVSAAIPDTLPIENVMLIEGSLPKFNHMRWADYAALVEDAITDIDFAVIEKELYDRHLMEIVGEEQAIAGQIVKLQAKQKLLEIETDRLKEVSFRQLWKVGVDRMQSLLTKLYN